MTIETPQAPASAPTNDKALISLIAGILGLTLLPLIGSIAAIITGNMAKNEIRAAAGAYSGEGLARAGVILGWVGVALGVLGFCGVILAVGIPICLVMLGLSTADWSSLLPLVLLI
jgi:hypothetical protein